MKRGRSRLGRSLQLCATRSRRCAAAISASKTPFFRAALCNWPSLREGEEFSGNQIKLRAGERRDGNIALFLQKRLKRLTGLGIAVVDEDRLRLFLKCFDPVQKPLLVCMAACSMQDSNFSIYGDILAEQPDFLHAVERRAAQRPLGLIACD